MSDIRKSSVAILGVPIDNLAMDDVLHAIEQMIAEGSFHQIATANVDFLIKAIHDEELRETLCRCDMVLADGMPLVWASRMMRTGLKERVSGADLVPRLAELSAHKGYRIFLLGADDESSARAAAWMETNCPGACVAGRYSPEFSPLDGMDHAEILARVEAARPDILLVAFGNPKQEKWLAMHRHRLRVPVCIGVGASLDFLGGKVSRAPSWMQTTGLEWFYRLVQEPTRLAKRYAGNALGLMRYLTLQLAATAAQAKQNSLTQITKETAGSAIVLRINGNFTGGLLGRFESEVRSAILSGSHVVLDLSDTQYIGPDALGCLIHLLGVTRQSKRELWLTGMRPLLMRVVRATQLGSQFRIAPKVADALRRIEPEPLPATATQHGTEWAHFRIGGQLIPVRTREVADLYQQVKQLMEQLPASATSAPEPEILAQEVTVEAGHADSLNGVKSNLRTMSAAPLSPIA